MVNFCAGLGYIHHALKRQSSNRQYHIAQGLALVFQYYHTRQHDGDDISQQEASYDVARTFHLLGLHHLALRYYQQVSLGADTNVNSLYNMYVASMTSGDLCLAKALMKDLPLL
jgi:general transcription factor 3C polypeptide 3 (transcription factor C subunit 4)